jgi:hypothetical protein
LPDSKNFIVLLHNRGDGTIKVKLRSDYESNLGDVEVEKNKTEKVLVIFFLSLFLFPLMGDIMVGPMYHFFFIPLTLQSEAKTSEMHHCLK